MRYYIQLSLLFTVFIITQVSHAQCNNLQTITICDMASIDFDTDGTPDGIINLYAETGTTVADGTWSTALNNAIVLDQVTGNLSVWELRNASVNANDYVFTLFNTICGTDPALTVELILGAYSGIALPPDDDDINYYVCSQGDPLNLDTVLISNETIPVAHINGTWSFISNPGGGLVDGSLFTGFVSYQPGLPRVDQRVYELVYTVSGILPCSAISQTFVKISVVRQVDSGIPADIDICESEILAGDYDMDIDVRDDQYLIGEDIEGFWIDELNGNSNRLIINIKDLYSALTNNGNNPRFGCETYSFTYSVERRSVVCEDRSSTVSFTVYEQLRPFVQREPYTVCTNDNTGSFDLYSLISFTQEGSNNFVYDDDRYVNWRLVSGNSALGLRPQPDFIQDFEAGYEYHLGTINTYLAQPGTYTFEYAVSPNINCKQGGDELCDPYETNPLLDRNYCAHPCEILTGQVTIEIFPTNYPGEDTDNINLCEDQGSVSLRSLLNTSGTNVIDTSGVWIDMNGDIVDDQFVFPDIDSPQTFNFTYTLSTVNGCNTEANLSFTIFKLTNSGTDATETLCNDNLTITLFDLLGENVDTTGIWRGPFGYQSTDHLGFFDANNVMLPVLGEGVYTYLVPGNPGCPQGDQSTVTITIVDPVEIGNDVNETFCKIDGRVSLFSLLDRDTVRTGVFEDTDNTGALTPEGVVEFETLTNGIYNFRYVVVNALPCDESSLNVAIQIVDLPEPVVPDQEFCILDAKRLDDIVVDVANYNWYEELNSDMPIINNPLLFDRQVYYIANLDTDGCESERVAVTINILNTGEKFSDRDEFCTLDFQDGVSPDGNNQNDTFEMIRDEPNQQYNIPEAFPDFVIKIYNRYGSLVYQGNRNTEEFRGESNVSLSLGDDLPSGTYFYVFEPNFANNLPIQGSFYLSR